MGFFKFKKPTLKNLGKTLLYSAAFGPGAGEMMASSPKIDEGMTEIGSGFGNLLTGGYIAQKEATAEAKKARDQAQSQYDAETAAAQETARKIAETEEERKRRLAAQGTQTPSTLYGTYLGIPGSAGKSLLG
jgi:hypothetical protein